MIQRHRNPIVWLLLIGLTVALGIGSRRFAHGLPVFVATYAGDTLWALAVFLLIGLVMPRATPRRVGLLALAFSVLVEVSQLYRAPWIDSIRRTTVGGLILGFGFLWSDLLCYAAGVGLGAVAEAALVRFSRGGPVAG
jgi:Protein of unknown function (DUF2809)